MRTGAQTILIRGGSHAHYLRSGHLVYGAANTLRAVPFNLANLAVIGPPVPVVSDVVTTPTGGTDAVIHRHQPLQLFCPNVAPRLKCRSRFSVLASLFAVRFGSAFSVRGSGFVVRRFAPAALARFDSSQNLHF